MPEAAPSNQPATPPPAPPAAPAQPATPAPSTPPPAAPAQPQSNAAQAQPPAPPAPAEAPAGPARGPDGKFAPKAEAAPAAPAADPLADWKPKLPEKLPDGVVLDEKRVTAAKAILADAKLSPADKMQALVDLDLQSRAGEIASIKETIQRQRVADLEKLKGDPEFGGAKYDATVNGSKSILSSLKYGPAVSKKLEMYGLDCDPDFVRLFAEVRSFIAEDSTATRLTNASPSVQQRPMSQLERQAQNYKNQPRR
jgi:hypothetical protein